MIDVGYEKEDHFADILETYEDHKSYSELLSLIRVTIEGCYL